MKAKGTWGLFMMAGAMLIAGPMMWFTVWLEMHNNMGYAWEKPYTEYEAQVIGMRWTGIVLLAYGLASMGLLAAQLRQANKRTRTGPAPINHADAGKPKVRTTVKIPMQTNQVHTVRRIIEKVLEPEGYGQQTIDGEEVWVKGNESELVSQRFRTAFAEKSLIIQGWTEDAFLGEMNLDGASEGKEPEKGMYLLIRKIYAVVKKGNF